MVDFRQLLSKSASEVKKPKLLPIGTYFGVTGPKFEMGETKSEKKTPFVRFKGQVQSAGPDIDASQLTDVNLTSKVQDIDFFITPDAEYRLVEFAKSLGVDTEGKNLGDLLPECCGKPIQMFITQEPNKNNPEEFFNRLKSAKGV